MAVPYIDAQLDAYLRGLPADYRPTWTFAYDTEDGHDQLYAIPASQYTRDRWGEGSYFAEDPDTPITAQALYTGQVPGAVALDANALPDEYREDYDIWQNRLMYGQMKEDSWNPFGDQLFGALMGLGLATGGAALAGGFAAPGVGAAGALGAGELGLETTFPLAAAGAADVGGTVSPVALGAASTIPGGVPAAVGAGGSTLAAPVAAAGPAAGGGGVLSTLADLAPILGPLISGGSSIIGGLVAGNAARDAAETQMGAAGDANKLLMDIYNQQRADMLPYLGAGYASLGQLAGMTDAPLTAGPYTAVGALNPYAGYLFDPAQYAFTPPVQPLDPAQYQFAPPSGQQVLNDDPGYQFRVQEGMKALQSGAAARGGLLGGGMVRGAVELGQNLASQEYSNAYNRALGRNVLDWQRAQYGNEQAYNRALGENQLGYERGLAGNQLTYGRDLTYNQDAANRALQQYQINLAGQSGLRQQRFNELASLAGLGQTTGGNLAQLAAGVGGNMASNITGAGAAAAAGQVGASNALMQGLTGVGNAANSYLQMQFLQNLLRQQQQPTTAWQNLPF